MDFLPDALRPMAEYNQFVVYKLVPSRSRIGKMEKIPISHVDKVSFVNAHDPKSWTTAENAIVISKSLGNEYGVGFVFTEHDPFWFLDIDDCLDESTQTWSRLAMTLCLAFPGAAIEVSTSGKGLHIFGTGKSEVHACKNKDYGLEFYTQKRFVALTGYGIQGSAALDCTPVLPWLIESFFPLNKETNNPLSMNDGWSFDSCPEYQSSSSDNEIIERALRSHSSASVFGTRASFKDLWNADQDALARAYPDPNRSCGYDESSADAALAQHLAFWTGNNCERIRDLMLKSGLVREKWERWDYLPRTILTACGRQKEWLKDKPLEPASISLPAREAQGETPRGIIVQGNTFVTLDQQIDLFQGCVYVCDDHKILIPGGYLLNEGRFKVMFGGYSFLMDNSNEKVRNNAWEAFTESRGVRFPKADTSCFQPTCVPGAIIETDGQTSANLYWPIQTPRKQGDVSPLRYHLDKIIPDPRDQVILLSYMAACIQFKGIKFQWCPLLQGVEGNGKTLFTRCVAFAIGARYSHFPKAAEIANKFNDWLYGKIFIGVEDIYIVDSKNEVIEALKPMITSDRQEIEPKGGAKITRDICANFLINTNHKDGLRINRNMRRFAPFYTAQQSLEDLKKAGMLGDYFPNLYDWLKRDGFAIVSDYLHTYEIPEEFNPAGSCKRAPITSSTEAAIDQGMGSIEQEIKEAIAQDTIGFKGGWVSSMALDRLLTKLNANRRIPHNKRRELMQSLGYDWHPALKEGRLNNLVLPDAGKPRLYIVIGHPQTGLLSSSEVAKAYSEAQK